MKRTTAFVLAGLQAAAVHAAPLFKTGTGDVEQYPALNGYINLGLQGVGRIPANQLDAFGETFGSVSGLQITNWKATPTGYSGTFLTLPDRGYNSGAIYSDYRTRYHQVDFTFSPYTGSAPIAPGASQFTLQYMGGSLLKLPDGRAFTTGALPTSSVALQIGANTSGFVPTTSGGKIAIDAEGGALFRDGSAYITDEYGPNIYYISDGAIAAVINPPASAMPRTVGGSLSYSVNGTSPVDPVSGRRSNQGMEAVAITPDGKTMFAMLQSATMQDSVSGAQNRQFTRLYKYDVSQSRTNPTLTAEYVVELPRFNDTKSDQTGLLPNRVAAQSEIVALDGDRLLLLSRDGNGNGNSGVTPAVFKSVMLMDLGKDSPTNIAPFETTSNYSVISGTVSSTIASGTATLTDTTAKLKPAITQVNPAQFVSLISQAQLSKFGLNTNDGSVGAPRSAATLSEKWEGMALVSALDPAKPNDYFLFVGNDNDFLTQSLKMKATTGATLTSVGSLGASVENDTMFLAYRLTLPPGGVDQSILTIGSAAASASMATFNLVDSDSVVGLRDGTTTRGISGSTLVIPGSMTVNRPIDTGGDGGALNLLGNSIVLNGSVSGAGALTVFGTSTGARLLLAGSNTFAGGLEINGIRVEASNPANLGQGQVNLNAGAILGLLQSGSFSQAAGFYVGGGAIDVGSGNNVLWSGSLVGTGTLNKTGKGSLGLTGNSGGFSGVVNVGAGTLTVGSGTSQWSGGSGPIILAGGARLNLAMSGTLDLRGRISAATDAAIYWQSADSASVLRLSTTAPLIYNTGQGSLSLGVSNKTLIYANGHYYQPLSAGLTAGTPVYIDAEGPVLNATQRSLGDREVAYKKLFFGALGFAGARVYADVDGNTIYDYGTQSTSTNLVGYWTKKNLPVILGPDGKGYITDGHHTTAGYLETPGAAILPNLNHVVLGTVVVSPSSQTSVGTQFWQDLAASNSAYLYGPSGNQLAQVGESQAGVGYDGLQPVFPSVSNPMPTTPNTASMANDLYRSLTWAMADGVVRTATNMGGTKLAGFSKANPFSPTGAEVNFVEFFWADFLRERVVWNDNAAVTSANLINAPVSFFAAAANGIALARSELYRDQYGRAVSDYTGAQFSANTRSWANATLQNGQAVSGDSYNLFLSDDVSIKGDIIPSGIQGVSNNLYINAGSLLSIPGSLQNLTSISINTGAVILIDWKDSVVNALTQNKTLTIPSGSADVVFSGDNDYSKLETLVIGAGTLSIDSSSQTTDQTISADISGRGSLRKLGQEKITLSGANTFGGDLTLEEGILTLGSSSIIDGARLVASPVGLGTLAVRGGATLGFEEEGVLLLNPVRFEPGKNITEPAVIALGENQVELGGPVDATASVQISGAPGSGLTLSGPASFSGDFAVEGATVRLSSSFAKAPETIVLRSGGGLQSLGEVDVPSSLTIEDEGRLDGGEGLLSVTGDIRGNGRLLIAGSPYGTVRLSGINTYTGGTSIEGTRVEVAVNAAEESLDGPAGAGRVFGSGDVETQNATLAFATSAQIPNTLRLSGELTIDVGANTGELSGMLLDGTPAAGSLRITGGPEGALILSGVENGYTGSTVVEGTTLRLFNTAQASILGTGTQQSGRLLPIKLDEATLQMIPDHNAAVVPPSTLVTGRDLVVGARGATLDVTDTALVWTGVISSEDSAANTSRFVISGNAGSQLELAAANTYSGGTEVRGGVLLKFSSDTNLGMAGSPVTLSNGGLFYEGPGAMTWSRPLSILESGLVDVGGRTVTFAGSLSGGGVLNVGRKSHEGSTFTSTTGTLVVGDSAKGFTGRLVASGGNLLVTASDALKNSTLETVANGGSVSFGTANVTLGGLAGDGSLNFGAAGTLTVGSNGMNSRFGGTISGGSLALTKVGAGNLVLTAKNTYGGESKIQEGTLTLELGGELGPAPISLGSKVTLVINGTGQDLSARFGTVASDALLVFAGTDTISVLKLPSNFAGRTLSLGQGSILVGTATAVPTAEIKKGESVIMTAGFPTTTGPSGKKSVAFEGAFLADGEITVAPTDAAKVVDLPALKGSGKLTLSGGFTSIAPSPLFTGTTALAPGASALLTGSLGATGSLELAAGSNLKVLPEVSTQSLTLPSLSGGGAVSLEAGKVVISGGNAAFSGSLTVARGVEVTIRGDLPRGTVSVSDSTLPLKVESLPGGNVSLPGTVTGSGGLMLGGNGTFTMTSSAVIGTSQLVVGGGPSEKPVLDVSNLAGGVLTLSGNQSLVGGGTVVGSVATSGLFAPGNSPGTFTVSGKTVNGVVSGGNLTVGAGGRIAIEYGRQVGDIAITVDQVVLAGTLTLHPSVSIAFSKFVDSGSWASFVTPATLDLSSVFKAGAIVSGTSGAALTPSELRGMISLDGNPLLAQVVATTSASSGTLSFRIEKVPYARYIAADGLRPLADFLSAAGANSPSAGLARYLSVLDASVTPAELNALVANLQSPVYAEAQRLSLRRTAAVSEGVQGRLVRSPNTLDHGWTAWSETYGWSFNRSSTAQAASWNGRNFGEILGVQKTQAGLTVGLFGAAGSTSASFSTPGSSLTGESFHGGAFVHAESGRRFVDASILAGRAEQTAVRNVSLGAVSGQGRARFSSGEYAGHVRLGLKVSELLEGLTLKPSVAVLLNGYSQGGAAESGLDGVGVITRKESGAALQTRVGYEASKKTQLAGKALDLLASAYWVRDANRNRRSVETRFNGSPAAGYSAAGTALGTHGLEVGVGAGVSLTSRTSARLNGVWQVREGSSQPSVNLGITVQF